MATALYWTFVLLYSAAMIGIGVFLRRKASAAGGSRSLEFWIARRALPGWWLGASLTAGWLMLGWLSYGMAQVYQLGAAGLWVLPVPWFVLCFVIVLMVPFVRRVGAVSVPEAIERRYGLSARAYLAILSFFVFIVWTQAELFIAGQLVGPFLGLAGREWVVVAVLVVPAAVYMWLGGFRVVVTTDLVQFVIMVAFMIALVAAAWLAASRASGGDILGALAKSAPPAGKPGAALDLFSCGGLFPLILIIGFLPGWMLEQDLVLRLQAAPTTRQARIGAWTALALIIVFVLLLPSLVAFFALVAFPPANGAPAAAVGTDATKIVSAFIAQMPLALSVFMVVGIVACQMSTVDTFTNVSALPLAYDFIAPVFFRNRLSDAAKAALGKWATLFAFLVASGLAMVNDRLGDVYNISSGVLSASIAVPALFIFWRRTTLPAVLAAASAGLVATVGAYWVENKGLIPSFKLPAFLAPSAGYNYVAAGVVASVVTIVVVSLLTRRSAPEKTACVESKPVDGWQEFTSRLTDRPAEETPRSDA